MSLNDLRILINMLQDRIESTPICSSRFRAGLIVNRRLMRMLKDSYRALQTSHL